MIHPFEDKRVERHICLKMGPPYGGRIFDFDVRDIFAICDLGHPSRCAIIRVKGSGRPMNVSMPYAEVYRRVYDRPYVVAKKEERKITPVPPPKHYDEDTIEMLKEMIYQPIMYQATLPGFEDTYETHPRRHRR